MSDSCLPALPARRDVKGMTKTLTELREHDRITATFKHPIYGVFTADGAAVFSPSVKTFMVGSLFIESGGKPEKNLQALVPSALPAETDDTDRETLQEAVSSLQHGDLVRAVFHQSPHGRFAITGVAIATSDDRLLTLGGWFLAHHGTAAARLKRLTRVKTVDEHTLPVPARITEWETDEPAFA